MSQQSSSQQSSWLHDVLACLRFYSRLPVPTPPDEADPHGLGRFARAIRMLPLAGALLGLGAAGVFVLALRLHAPPLAAAFLALIAGVLLSGGMHEDGLADCADGFGGGGDRERKLAIMRDSRLGSYGATALVLSLGLRASLIAALAPMQGGAVLALVAAGALSRCLSLTPLIALPPARADGAGRAAGALTWREARPAFALALALAALPLLAGFSLAACLAAAALAVLSAWGICALARRQIGGQTGDVAGLTQQAAECAMLFVFAASF
jgi:adenosylcobinamide-GDP ribazoletransferase